MQSRELTGLPFATSVRAGKPARRARIARAVPPSPALRNARDGRDVIGRRREGGLIPLFMTMSAIDERRQALRRSSAT